MIYNKKGSTAIVNLISVLLSIIIIAAVGMVYYIFLSPDKLEFEEITYASINSNDYEVDKEFEKGLDNTIDFKYNDSDLDMHKDLKDYYQGREDPFSQSDDRNEVLNLNQTLNMETEKVTNSRPDLVPEEEIDIEEENKGTSTILGF